MTETSAPLKESEMKCAAPVRLARETGRNIELLKAIKEGIREVEKCRERGYVRERERESFERLEVREKR
eukprot:1353252-Amorphochlora_amoeboformis.AAC.1